MKPGLFSTFRFAGWLQAALLGVTLSLSGATAGAAEAPAALLRRQFVQPAREFSSGPLWVWNDLLTEAEIRGTLHDLAGQHVRQVFVHPRFGLLTPYLTAEWFRLWQVALDEARRLDLNIWIYDENSYPSGFAGGLLMEAMPEARGQGLHFSESGEAPKWTADTLAVFRLGPGGTVENISQRVQTGAALAPGAFLVARREFAGNAPRWGGTGSYSDLLRPGVTEKFLQLTHEAYRSHFGAEFGRHIPGSFSDEAKIQPAGGLPWTDDLPAQFQHRWGYSLIENLASLSRPVGDWRRVRHNYFWLLNELFAERWGRPYSEWCAKNGLAMTGHYWDHTWPDCTQVPDNMTMAAWQQIPGIDCLLNQYQEDTNAQFGNVRIVREIASVANQLGRSRRLCEVYGAGGWDLRFEDMKRIGDWLGVLGVNLFTEHLSFVSIRGVRKRDHPQSFSYHEPWWDSFHGVADYLTRMSFALSQGEQVNRIAVLEPTATAWMYQGDNAKLKEIGGSFFQLLIALEKAQVEYDIVSEYTLAGHGAINGSGLRVGQRTYDVLVIPPHTETLNQATAELLKQYSRAGGPILCLGEPPSLIDGKSADAAVGPTDGPNWFQDQPANAPSRLRRWTQPGEFAITRAPDDRGLLFHQRRQLADGELLLLVNTSLTASSSGEVTARARTVEEWNLTDGAITPFPSRATSTGVSLAFSLPPAGSLLLFLDRNGIPAPVNPAKTDAATVERVHERGPLEIRRLGPNVLTLDCVDLTVGGETLRDKYCYDANLLVWQKHGLTRNPSDRAVQVHDEILRQTFPAGSGFEASYRFRIAGPVPAHLAIVIERPDLYTVLCNGTPVSAQPGAWWLDHAFGRIEIAAAAHPGDNVVTIKAAPLTVMHELEPAYVLGDFTLRPDARGFVIEPDQTPALGKWNEQGLPFFAQGMSYRQHFAIESKAGTYRVSLPAWFGSVAKVSVNGREAGLVYAPPYACDVTHFVTPGDNVIDVTVIGTLKNTLGPHHGNPELGAAWPALFEKAPPILPAPGASYSTVGYGLFAAPVLWQECAP